MEIKQKHRIAEDQVRKYLGRVPRVAHDVLLRFPRPLEEIANLAFPTYFETVPALTERLAATVLRERHRWIKACDDSDDPLLGFLVANEHGAVVFSNPANGPASELFTKAHELGHLALEHLPRLPPSSQGGLFGAGGFTHTISRRDGADSIPVEGANLARTANKSLHDLKAREEGRQRERFAHLFACELLAPVAEVAELVRGNADETAITAEVMAKFGLSRYATRILLKDLSVIDAPEAPPPLLT